MTDSTACRDCGKPIGFDKLPNGKWVPMNPDGSKHTCRKENGGGGSYGKSPAEQHDIRREAVLNAAVAFASAKLESGTEISAQQVLQVAKAFLQFVEEDRPA